jgi:hypothetical protein
MAIMGSEQGMHVLLGKIELSSALSYSRGVHALFFLKMYKAELR